MTKVRPSALCSFWSKSQSRICKACNWAVVKGMSLVYTSGETFGSSRGWWAMKWRKPIFSEEREGFVQTAQDLGLSMDELREAMKHGHMAPLDGYTWCTLENTDCNETFTLGEVERLALKRYGRDVGSLCRAITSGQTVPAPIILDRPGKRSWLVSGNIRLMLCRGLNLLPDVWRISV